MTTPSTVPPVGSSAPATANDEHVANGRGRRRLLLVASLAALITIATVVVVRVVGDGSGASTQLGAVTLPLPEGWVSLRSSERLVLAPTQALATADVATSPRAVLERVPAGTDPAATLATVAGNFDGLPGATLVDGPSEVAVGGLPAVEIVINVDGVRRAHLFFSVAGDGYSLLLEAPVAQADEAFAELGGIVVGLRVEGHTPT